MTPSPLNDEDERVGEGLGRSDAKVVGNAGEHTMENHFPIAYHCVSRMIGGGEFDCDVAKWAASEVWLVNHLRVSAEHRPKLRARIGARRFDQRDESRFSVINVVLCARRDQRVLRSKQAVKAGLCDSCFGAISSTPTARTPRR